MSRILNVCIFPTVFFFPSALYVHFWPLLGSSNKLNTEITITIIMNNINNDGQRSEHKVKQTKKKQNKTSNTACLMTALKFVEATKKKCLINKTGRFGSIPISHYLSDHTCFLLLLLLALHIIIRIWNAVGVSSFQQHYSSYCFVPNNVNTRIICK